MKTVRYECDVLDLGLMVAGACMGVELTSNLVAAWVAGTPAPLSMWGLPLVVWGTLAFLVWSCRVVEEAKP